MAYTKEQRLINTVSGSTKEEREEVKGFNATGSFNIPNKSGDHVRSIKRDVPVYDYDLVNKSYADGLLNNPFIVGDLTMQGGSIYLQTGAFVFFGTADTYAGCLDEDALTIEAKNSIGIFSPVIYLSTFSGALSASGGVVSGGTLSVSNGGTGGTSFTSGYVLFGNGTDSFLCENNFYWDASNNRLSLGNGTYKNAVLNVEKSNTDYTNTNGAGSAIFLSNASATGQTVILCQINNNNMMKFRSDYVSDLSWVSYATADTAGHYFVVGGDYPSGTTFLKVTPTGTIAGNSVVGSNSDCPFEVETTATVGKQAMTIDQNDADQAFIDYQGTSAANQSNNISTVNGDGSVTGPKNYSSTAGWEFAGMVRVEVNGTAYWMPYYSADTS